MARIALYASFGLVVFLASAGGSLYLQRATQSAEPNPETASTDGSNPVASDVSGDTLADAGETETGELPVVVRPRRASTEDILQLGAGMRNRERLLDAREEEIEKDRAQVNLVLEDIKKERAELESLHTEIHGKLAAAEKLLGEVTLQRQQLTVEREAAKKEVEEFRSAQIEYKEEEVENLKRVSQWLESMDPKRAAECLRELSDNGEVDTAVHLLGNLEDREAAKVLDELDNALVTQLFNEAKGAKRAPKKLR